MWLLAGSWAARSGVITRWPKKSSLATFLIGLPITLLFTPSMV